MRIRYSTLKYQYTRFSPLCDPFLTSRFISMSAVRPTIRQPMNLRLTRSHVGVGTQHGFVQQREDCSGRVALWRRPAAFVRPAQ